MADHEESMLRICAQRLAASERGVNTMQHLLNWLDGGGLTLDRQNQTAVLTILSAAWNGKPTMARDIMREYIES